MLLTAHNLEAITPIPNTEPAEETWGDGVVKLTPEQEAENMALLQQWNEAKIKATACKPAIEEELRLRKAVVKAFFPNAQEGANNKPLLGGYTLKAGVTLTRKVDPAALDALSSEFEELLISKDKLLDYKPSLKVSAYRELSSAQRHLFDQALIVTDGSPTLEIAPPKGTK